MDDSIKWFILLKLEQNTMKAVFKAILLGLGSITLLCIIILVCYAIFGNGVERNEVTKAPAETTIIDQDGINKRIEVAQRLGSKWQKGFGYEPIVTLEAPDKTILILESVRLTQMHASILFINNVNIGRDFKELGFKKIIFIQQRYNAREYNGWIYDVEKGYLE